MTDEKKRPGFWHRFPGTITAIAATITALTGFIGAMHQAGFFNVGKVQSQPQIAGSYHVRGKNPNETSYVGEATIKHKGDRYEIVWRIGNQTHSGTGTLDDDLLRVKWEQGLVTYIVEENGALEGSWADGRGTETLIPHI